MGGALTAQKTFQVIGVRTEIGWDHDEAPETLAVRAMGCRAHRTPGK